MAHRQERRERDGRVAGMLSEMESELTDVQFKMRGKRHGLVAALCFSQEANALQLALHGLEFRRLASGRKGRHFLEVPSVFKTIFSCPYV